MYVQNLEIVRPISVRKELLPVKKEKNDDFAYLNTGNKNETVEWQNIVGKKVDESSHNRRHNSGTGSSRTVLDSEDTPRTKILGLGLGFEETCPVSLASEGAVLEDVPDLIRNESVPEYNWHSAGSLSWPFPMLKY